MPSPEQLLDVIRIQTQIVKQGRDLAAVMDLVTRETLQLLKVDGGAIELAEGDAMICRSVAGLAEGQLGLRLGLESSLSGLCVRSGVMLESADTDTGPRVDREACQRMGLRSMLVVRSATTRAASASSRRWHVSPIVSGVRSGCCWAVRKTARYTAGTGTS